MEAGGVLEAWKVRWKQCDCALFWSGDSAKPKSSLLIGRLIRRGPRFQNQGAKKGGAQGRKLVYDPYENHMESIRITANKMESIRITIHKLDFFDNITKVGRIVIYEFTTPFTGLPAPNCQRLPGYTGGLDANNISKQPGLQC